MDRDAVGRDDFLGEATVPLVFDEHKAEGFNDWVPLTKIKSGAVLLRISCFGPATGAAAAAVPSSTATTVPAVAQ